ncbi:MAG TPA: ABC transporter permease [Bryobacteraceae bacterium]|jgi:putative ABC transport system permease protein
MLNDFRYALRVLVKSPVFSLTAILTIALGIAAATAIFSVTNAVLLRPLPYKDPSRLMIARTDMQKRNVRDFPFSAEDFIDFRRETAEAFESVGAVFTFRRSFPLPDGNGAEQLKMAGVTPNFFQLLGGRIVAGRDFNESDGQPGPPPPDAGAKAPPAPPPVNYAILSYEYWQRRFGGSREIFGRPLPTLQNQGPVVVGVLAPGFELLFPPLANVERKPDVWFAVRLQYDVKNRNSVFLHAIAKLRPGVTVERAQTQTDLVTAEIRKGSSIKETSGFNIAIEPMDRNLVATVRPAIVALMGAVIFLLLIACANVANLLLVRASLREREFAVRTALGGGWWTLARQMMAEVLVLSALGTTVGVVLASIGLDRLLALAPANLPRLDDVRIDPTVIGFAALAGLVAAAIFGLAPLVHVRKPDVMQVLRSDGRSPGLGGAGKFLRNAVVVIEVALCFVLLIGSGLMFRSFLALQHVDPGFDASGLFKVTLESSGVPNATPEARAAFQNHLRQAFEALPGVSEASATSSLALNGGFNPIRWGLEDALSDPSKFKAVDNQFVLPGYLETMKTRLIEGRMFTEQDNAPKHDVVIVDTILAQKAFGGASAVGKRILIRVRSPEPEWVEIIGVVAHQRTTSLVEPGREEVYFADAFGGSGISNIWVLRAQAGDPAQLFARAKEALTQVDPRIVMVEPGPMSELVGKAQSPTRFQLSLIGIFAAIAALLASVGLYGVLSTVVRQRTAEIGVRMALGAAPGKVFGLVVGHGLRLSAVGVALGTIAGLLLTRLMSTMLVDVKPADPLTYIAVAIGFLLIAALSAWIPARRAAALDPMNALRGV